MIVRDRNRPSIIIWAPQVNESDRNPELYTRTKDLAYSLDGTRQTSGSSTSRRAWRARCRRVLRRAGLDVRWIMALYPLGVC